MQALQHGSAPAAALVPACRQLGWRRAQSRGAPARLRPDAGASARRHARACTLYMSVDPTAKCVKPLGDRQRAMVAEQPRDGPTPTPTRALPPRRAPVFRPLFFPSAHARPPTCPCRILKMLDPAQQAAHERPEGAAQPPGAPRARDARHATTNAPPARMCQGPEWLRRCPAGAPAGAH